MSIFIDIFAVSYNITPTEFFRKKLIDVTKYDKKSAPIDRGYRMIIDKNMYIIIVTSEYEEYLYLPKFNSMVTEIVNEHNRLLRVYNIKDFAKCFNYSIECGVAKDCLNIIHFFQKSKFFKEYCRKKTEFKNYKCNDFFNSCILLFQKFLFNFYINNYDVNEILNIFKYVAIGILKILFTENKLLKMFNFQLAIWWFSEYISNSLVKHVELIECNKNCNDRILLRVVDKYIKISSDTYIQIPLRNGIIKTKRILSILLEFEFSYWINILKKRLPEQALIDEIFSYIY